MSPTAPILLSLLPTFISHGSSALPFIYTYCPNTTFFSATNAAYRSNINTLLSSLTSAANRSTTPGFHYSSTNTSTSAAVYGLYLCRGDNDPATCKYCVATASAKLAGDCLRGKQAVVWYEFCMIRYSNESFFGQLEFDLHLIMSTTQNITGNVTAFNDVLAFTVREVAEKAASGGAVENFATGQADFSDFQTVYALGQCTPDLSSSDCNLCLQQCISDLPNCCQNKTGGRVLYLSCNLRYELYPFYDALAAAPSPAPSESVVQPSIEVGPPMTCDQQDITVNIAGFNKTLNIILQKVAEDAAKGGSGTEKHGRGHAKFDDFQTVYALGTCIKELNSTQCSQCLQSCIKNMRSCHNSQGGHMQLYGCYLQYDIHPINDTDAMSPPPTSEITGPKSQNERRRHIPEIIISSVIVAMILLISALWLFYYKKKAKQASEDVSDIISAESLQMEFSTIRAATRNFAADRKLGQGGFGEVYKGTLENGKDIAVKRLSSNSGQGIAEFKTEVLLVAKLQHRNLVKLLGFCISGKEKILVYEYLPNSSLDKILFEPTKRMALNWETRFKIISGLAKGLLYLHEDSRLRIVHRDLKSSNILLDEAMNPKISDFGLSKLFGVDQSQDATNTIVGTYGYMAPEYVLTGHYSMKSDVYAFGIIILEIVSGQRNKYQYRLQLEEALLHRAWRLWKEGEALKLVDETLGNNYAREDVMKCIHIGLLCIQENVTKRPNMTLVVAALGGQSIDLPLPALPNFFGVAGSASPLNPGQGASVNRISDISEFDPTFPR